MYDVEQFAAIADEQGEAACGCATEEGRKALHALAKGLEGKIWNAKVYTRKPI